jgi:hypothetical protein
MKTTLITAGAIPARSRLHPSSLRLDYTDAYQLVLLPGPPAAAPAVARQLFASAPGWVRRLLALRDWLVHPFELVTFPAPARPAVAAELAPGGRLGPFLVFSVSPEEVVLGQDDQHLSFRVSVRVEPEQPGQAVLTTAVEFHNRAGRVYFAFIRPFHHLVVKALLRYALTTPAA